MTCGEYSCGNNCGNSCNYKTGRQEQQYKIGNEEDDEDKYKTRGY